MSVTDKIGILDPEGINPNPLTNEPYSQSYKIFSKSWSNLPAYSHTSEILSSLEKYPLTFIVSATGSGKTVLVPKLALHYLKYKGKIAITLPKRAATHSAASFAAKTLDVPLGTHVGYVYKGSDKKMLSDMNKLLYMTDGFLVMKFVEDPSLSEFNIIIIDEAHERRIQIDELLLFLKKILESGKRPDLRVIIMSATIDSDKYQKYFEGIKSNVINIGGRTNYEITTHFLEKPARSYLVEGFRLIENIINEGTKKDILFFITTSEEAYQLCRNIRFRYTRIYCIEVYSDMDEKLKIYAESRDKFLELGNYDQKLVMATNVAESSLTIDGLTYVIDSGYELHSYFDPITYGQIFEKKLISKAQALQRRGRVGRTEPGVCYHLLTKEQFDLLNDYPVPDILKQDITIDILKIIRLTPSQTYKQASQWLQELMDPPKKIFVDVAHKLFELYDIIDANGKMNKIGYDITNFSSLPLNRSLFLIYAFKLHCAKQASIIVEMIETLKGKLSNLFYKSDTVNHSDVEKSSSKDFIKKMHHPSGDHLTYLKIFEEYKKVPDPNVWARKYGIKLDVLKKIGQKSRDHFNRLRNLSKESSSHTTNIGDEASRTAGNDTKRIMEALKMSHKHLLSRKLSPVFSQKEIDAQVNKDSVVYQKYNRRELLTKKFIYDKLVNINNNWEFNTVTII